MKVLIITNHYLDGLGGGTTGSRGFINAFAAIFSDCILIYPDNGKDVSNFIRPGLTSIGCKDNRSKWVKGLGVYFGKLHRFGSVAKKTITEFRPDIVVFDTSTVSSGLIRYVRKMGIKTITIHHNVEKDYFRDNPPSFLYRLPYIYYMTRTERDAVNLSDLNLTHTDSDTSNLKKYYSRDKNLNIKCIGLLGSDSNNMTDFEFKSTSGNNGKKHFVMSGRLSDPQSDDSFIDFIWKYLPVLRELCNDFELIIAGSNPSSRLVEICRENKIRLIANPVDMFRIVADSDIYICPVNKGSGLKIRILDGLRAGIPVLTHEVSARGYEYFINTGAIHVYFSVDSFRSSLKEILDTETDRKLRIEQYRDYFSEKNGISRLRSLIEHIITE